MQPNGKEEFIAIFYDHYIPWLVHALSRVPGNDKFTNDNVSEYALSGVGYSATPQSVGDGGFSIDVNSESNSKLNNIDLFGVELSQDSVSARASWVNIVDLLSFCVKHHQCRIKSYMLHNDVVAKVLRLLNCREKYVKFAGKKQKYLRLNQLKFTQVIKNKQ